MTALPQSHHAPLPDGLEIAGYRIVKKIAAGGFSIVYLAYDALGVVVAIKEYLPAALVQRHDGALAPAVAEPARAAYQLGLKCFYDEARALRRIAHPNVVRVVDFFRAHDTAYLVMAYEAGHTLATQLAAQGPLAEASIRSIFYQLLQGLRAVHAQKLLHLDIKPANIQLRNDGTPLLLDFGAARQPLQGLEQVAQGVGAPMYTPGYAAPELYTVAAHGGRAALGPWSDVYGVGASLYACRTGAPPPAAGAAAQGRGGNDALDAACSRLLGEGHYAPELVALACACLQAEPLDRPQSLFAVQKTLQ